MVPIVPHARENEGVASYLQHLAVVNYKNSPRKLLQNYAEIPYKLQSLNKYSSLHQPLKEVFYTINPQLKLDEMCVDRFYPRLFEAGPTDKEIRDHVLSSNTRICPDCLREDYYHRVYWDISLVTVCDRHGCYLIDQCAVCNRKITVNNLMHDRCTCGHRFSLGSAGDKPSEFIYNAQTAINSLLFDSFESTAVYGVFASDIFSTLRKNWHTLVGAYVSVDVTSNSRARIKIGSLSRAKKDVLATAIASSLAYCMITEPDRLPPILQADSKNHGKNTLWSVYHGPRASTNVRDAKIGDFTHHGEIRLQMKLPEVALAIGLSYQRTLALFKAGILKSSGLKRRFDIADVNNLYESIVSGVESFSSLPDGIESLEEVMLRTRRLGVSLVQIVKGLQNGHLNGVKLDPSQRIDEICFKTQDVESWIIERRYVRLSNGGAM